MHIAFVVLFTQLLCVWGESCDVNAAIQDADADAALELLQMSARSQQEASQEASEEDQWVHYNPPGWRGGRGRGYYHYNPPGWRGGWGHGATYVHHNPPGWRGGPGYGHTYYHHRGYGWGHGTTVYHHHGWR